jgi:hypothetical protein
MDHDYGTMEQGPRSHRLSGLHWALHLTAISLARLVYYLFGLHYRNGCI